MGAIVIKRLWHTSVICTLMTLLSNSLIAADFDKMVRIVTDIYPPHQYQDDTGKLAGLSTEKVRAFMEKAGVPYRFVVMPWNRAIKLVATDPLTLIFSLDRTAERETKFIWLYKLNTVQHHLMGRQGMLPEGFTRQAAISGKYSAICERGTSLCRLLSAYGFPDSQILTIAGSDVNDLVTLLQRGRVDFTIADKQVLLSDYNNNLNSAQLHIYATVGEGVSDYLAGSANTNPELIAHIQQYTATR